MELWKQKALQYRQEGLKPKEIAEKLEQELGMYGCYTKVCDYIHRTAKKDLAKMQHPEQFETPEKEKSEEPKKEKRVVIQNQEPEHHEATWDGCEIVRFGLISDTHLGSKYAQISHLHDFYNFCEKEGIKTIYHAGDVTDGVKMRPGHEYDVYDCSADGQRDDVIKHYPYRKGITTHFITGNHDASLFKHVGYDIGRGIADKREDLIYLGRDCAVINLTPNCTLELRHPWDGCSYAASYRLQKMIEAMEADSKPNIFAVGHYHKELTMMYRNVHGILVPCFQSQTPFSRGKGLSVFMGGMIIAAHVDKNGYIQRFIPEYRPYYSAIKDDYKNFK